MNSSPRERFFSSVAESSGGFGLAAFTLAVVIGTVVPLILIYLGGVQSSMYLEELLNTSLTVAVGILMTGVVSVAVDNHNKRKEWRAANREFRLDLISRLRQIHDRVKIAALLIEAHESAKTYGEQMRELISVRVAVLDLRRAIYNQPRAVDGFADTLVEEMDGIAGYLFEMTEEYKSQYKRISAIQLYTSEWDREKARSAGKGQKPPIPEKMETSSVAWRELKGQAFPMLKIFLESDSNIPENGSHKTRFSDPLGDAIQKISAIE